MTTPMPCPWYTTRRFRLGALIVLAVVLTVEAYLAIFIRDNDFLVHRGFGQAFLAGEPLRAGQSHYLLSRGLFNALTSWLPYLADRALHFVAAVLMLAWCFVSWHRLANPLHPLDARSAFAAGVFTLMLVGCYVHRDLDDCGLQLFLLFFLTMALAALAAGSSLGCGFWLGLAAAYKVTPLLFFPYLIWKRRWQAAGWMACFLLLFNLLPVLYIGPDMTIRCHHHWLEFTRRCLSMPDPSQNPLEPPRHLNQGLTPAIARFLLTHPLDHPLYLDHPWFLQPGNLDPASAKRMIQVVLASFALLLAWRFRRRDSSLPAEWAALTVLCAILSPLCWLQHLVLIVPCIFLWMRAYLAGATLPRWHWPVLAVLAILVLGVHRELMSRALYSLLVSYKAHTIANLLAILLVLTLPDPGKCSFSEQPESRDKAAPEHALAA